MEYNLDLSLIPVTNPNGDLENEVYSIYKYPPNYLGFIGQDLTPGDFVELNNPLTSVDREVQEDHLMLYPNPTQGKLTLRGEMANCTIQILSPNNRVYGVWSNQNNLITIDISDMPSGLYFVSVTNNLNSSISIKKIFKQ